MFSETDRQWMRQAIAEARKAAAAGEVPIGAVVVSGGRVIGRGHNMTEQLHDVTAHAEMIALTAASQALGGKYMPDATLYVTVEPCCMCAGAIGWSQIGRIVFGATDPKRGYVSIVGAGKTPFHPKATVQSGLMEEESAAMMRDFFAQKRR
jgi:tRNA(adenine34) deaminase